MALFTTRQPPAGARPGSLVIDEEAATPTLHVFRYSESELTETDVDDLSQLDELVSAGGVAWIDIQGLGDEEALRKLAKVFSLHPLALEDVVNLPQRPKSETYDDHELLLTHMLRLVDDWLLEVEQVGIIVGTGYVLTFQERRGDVLDPVRAHLRSGRGPLRRAGADYLAYSILDTIIDAYFPVLESIGDRLELLEDRVMLSPSPATLRQVSRAKRMLFELRRTIWPQRDAINSQIRDPSPFIGDSVRVYLRDTHDHCVQLAEVLESYRDHVSGLMNMYLSLVSNKTNEVMRVLTVMATIFIPLTFLTGIYGMNFDRMPELHERWGYPIALTVMAIIAIGMLVLFRRRGWLSGSAPDDVDDS